MISNKLITDHPEKDDIQHELKAATNSLLLNSSFLDNPGLMNSFPGIAWIYMQLHRLEGGSHFKNEMEYWNNKLSLLGDKDSLLTRHYYNGGDNIFGILEGLAGIMLLTKSLKKEALKQ